MTTIMTILEYMLIGFLDAYQLTVDLIKAIPRVISAFVNREPL